jgi:hypothetical protein
MGGRGLGNVDGRHRTVGGGEGMKEGKEEGRGEGGREERRDNKVCVGEIYMD